MYEINSYFTISKASEIVGVETHVLRFWEKSFSIIMPNKTKNGRRYYSSSDIKNLLAIKKLLYEDGFTIRGAIKYFKNKNKSTHKFEESYYFKKISEIERLLYEGNNLIKTHCK